MSREMWSLLAVATAGVLDFLLYYFIMNNLIGNKIKQTLKSITYKEGLIVCLYIVSMVVLELTRSQFKLLTFDWIVTTIVLLTITIIFVKNRNSSYTIDEIILMFLISHTLIFVIIIPMIILNLIFGEMLTIILIGKMFTLTVGALLIVNQIDFNKLFVYIIHRLALKITIFVISLISISMFIFFVTSHDLNVTQVLVPSGTLIILIIVGLVYTLKAAHQYEIVVPEKYHDIKKILTLLNLKAERVQTVDELKEMIDATIELLDIKVVKPELQKSKDEPEDFESFITVAINSLKLNHQSTVEVKTNIQYFESHRNVNAMSITHMLGVLLENALETGTQRPILVDVLSTEHILFIKVANETKSKTSQDLDNMLVKGYSTKGKIGRGFGLPKLKELVESHQGNMTISQELNMETQTNYISFMLNF